MIMRPVSPSSDAVGSSRISRSGWLTIARDRHALLLAAGQLDGRQLRAIGETDDAQVGVRGLDRVVPRLALQDQRNCDVLGGREPRNRW
jgi:hypothetical protein